MSFPGLRGSWEPRPEARQVARKTLMGEMVGGQATAPRGEDPNILGPQGTWMPHSLWWEALSPAGCMVWQTPAEPHPHVTQGQKPSLSGCGMKTVSALTLTGQYVGTEGRDQEGEWKGQGRGQGIKVCSCPRWGVGILLLWIKWLHVLNAGVDVINVFMRKPLTPFYILFLLSTFMLILAYFALQPINKIFVPLFDFDFWPIHMVWNYHVFCSLLKMTCRSNLLLKMTDKILNINLPQFKFLIFQWSKNWLARYLYWLVILTVVKTFSCESIETRF